MQDSYTVKYPAGLGLSGLIARQKGIIVEPNVKKNLKYHSDVDNSDHWTDPVNMVFGALTGS